MKAIVLAEKLENLDLQIQDFENKNIKVLSTNFYKKSWKKLNELDDLNNYLFELFFKNKDDVVTENVRKYILNFERYVVGWMDNLLAEIKNKGIKND